MNVKLKLALRPGDIFNGTSLRSGLLPVRAAFAESVVIRCEADRRRRLVTTAHEGANRRRRASGCLINGVGRRTVRQASFETLHQL